MLQTIKRLARAGSISVCLLLATCFPAAAGTAPTASRQPDQSATSLTPSEIAARAFAKLRSYPIPPYVVYTNATSTTHQDAFGTSALLFSNAARVAYRSSDSVANVAKLPIAGPNLPVATIYITHLGPLAEAIVREAWRRGPPASDPIDSELPIIASTVAKSHTYTIGLAGVETVEGAKVFHLTFSPVVRTDTFPLRDLWVDTSTFDVLRAHFLLENLDTVKFPGLCDCDFDVYFVGAGPYWVMAAWTETGIERIGLSFKTTGQVDQIAFPPALPDWVFDEKQYQELQGAHHPDFMKNIYDIPREN